MNKKVYIHPAIRIRKIEGKSDFLAGSDTTIESAVPTSKQEESNYTPSVKSFFKDSPWE